MKARKVGGKLRALSVENPVACELAEQVSKQMGVTISEAVIAALREKLQKTGKPIDRAKPVDRAKVAAILARFDALPVLDDRSPDELLGYDDFGLPG
jgi:antitoxin VapB